MTKDSTSNLGKFGNKLITPLGNAALAFSAVSAAVNTVYDVFVKNTTEVSNSLSAMSSKINQITASLPEDIQKAIERVSGQNKTEGTSTSSKISQFFDKIGAFKAASVIGGEMIGQTSEGGQGVVLRGITNEEYEQAKKQFITAFVSKAKSKPEFFGENLKNAPAEGLVEFKKLLGLDKGQTVNVGRGTLQGLSKGTEYYAQEGLKYEKDIAMLIAADAEKAAKAAEKKSSIEQISFEIAKNAIKSELEIATLKARQNNYLDQQLKSSQILGNLSEDQVRYLEYEIALRDQNRSTSDEIQNILLSQLDSSKALFADEKKFEAVKEKIKSLSQDELLNDGLRNQLLSDFSGLSDTVAEKMRESSNQQINDAKKLNETKKDGLTIDYNSLKAANDKAQIMKNAINSAKEMATQSSFDINFQAQSAIYANDARKNQIDRQIAAGNLTQAQQKSLEIEKAGLDIESTRQKNTQARSDLLAKAREQTLGTKAAEGSFLPSITQQSQGSLKEIIDTLKNPITAVNKEEANKRRDIGLALERELQNLDQKSAADISAAEASKSLAETLAGVTYASTQLQDAFTEMAVVQAGENARFALMTETSGRRIAELTYEAETSDLQAAASTPEERAQIAKARSVKGIGQKFSEAFSETDTDRANRFTDTLVSGAEKFRDTMIDGMVNAIEQGGSLGDILQSAALDFAREMTRANMKNIFSMGQSAVGSLFQGYASGGKITGGSGSKDDVPAMLMGGEYVMNKRAVSKYGTGFMEALNNGSVSGFADGGSVIRSRGLATDVINSSNVGDQTGEGGFQMPGYYGSGAITGKKDLLSYASQAYTSGAGDIIGGGDNSAYIDITPESVRLTNFGRNQGPMAAAVRESKEQSLDLYFQQLAAEKQAKEEEKAQKKAFKRAIITALITSAVGAVVGAGAAGFKAGVAGAGPDAGFMGSLGAGAKGVFAGGDIGGGVMAGGLKNLFSGNYQLSQISDLKGYQQYLSGNPKGIEKFLAGSASKSITGAGGGTLNAWSGDGLGPDGLPSFSTPFDSGLPNGPDGELLPPMPFDGNSFSSDRVPIIKATGGVIPQASGIDTVPAMLSGGEFIMNAGATQRIGASNLNAMNSGASTETSSSAINDQLINKLDELIKITKESSKPVTVNVSSQQGQAGGDNQGEENKSEKDQNLSRKIKAAVIAVLQEEKRLGGVLRRS